MSSEDRHDFLDLYQRTSAHLSQLRSATPDPALDARLSRLLADASSALYGQREGGFRAFFAFFSETFVGIWTATSDSAQDSIPPALAEAYVNEDFEAYYSSEAAAEFATTVFINNIWVSFLAFASGILLCVGTAWVLINNGILIGTAGGLFAASGELPKFFGLILPHGFLELTAIIIAGGAGLVLGWTVISPGDRTRGDALAEEGRRSVVVVIGLVLVFFAAALIEGFVTGSPLSTLTRVGIGFAVWLAFTLYVVVFGRRAAALGKTGMMGDLRPRWEDAPAEELTSRATVALNDR